MKNPGAQYVLLRNWETLLAFSFDVSIFSMLSVFSKEFKQSGQVQESLFFLTNVQLANNLLKETIILKLKD